MNQLELAEFDFDVITVNDKGVKLRKKKESAKYFVEDLGDGITLEMTEIPGGIFTIGSPESEEQRSDDENPQHNITIPSFYIAKFQVTQAQWKKVAKLPSIERELKPNPSYFKGDDLPVEQVNWYDAVEFCQRLSKDKSKEYRLPSEAEWEYACRAGTSSPFHFGESITSNLVNYYGNFTYANAPTGESRGSTTPVGIFPPNPFGLYDMHGNLFEWCADSYQDSYQVVPKDGSAWIDKNNSKNLLRGGSWDSDPHLCRSASRYWMGPDYDAKIVGFRCLASFKFISTTVTLTIIEGKLKGKKFFFNSPCTCIIGRHPECTIVIPKDSDHKMISRYHCLLDINPLRILVRDLNSLHGTYLNGECIGKKKTNQTVEEGKPSRLFERNIHDGDLIKLSNTTFKVTIMKH